MKIKIVSDCQGGTPLQHLATGTVVDLSAEDAAPLWRAGKAVLVQPDDRPMLLKHLKADDDRAHRLAGGSFR